MSISETDLELLECYLDDELGGAQLESLRKRLSSEPSLTVAMDELRGQREMRQMFFSTCEPDAQQVEQLIRAAKQEATREIVWGQRNRKLRGVSGLAACLLVGFFVGRGTYTDKTPDLQQTAVQPQVQQSVASQMVSGPRVPSPNRQQVVPTIPDEVVFDGPRIQSPGDFNINRINPGNITPNMVNYQVRLVDANGNVVRQFNSPAEFNRFVSEQNAPSSQPANLRGN